MTSLGKRGRGHDPGAGSEEREAGGCENTVEGGRTNGIWQLRGDGVEGKRREKPDD